MSWRKGKQWKRSLGKNNVSGLATARVLGALLTQAGIDSAPSFVIIQLYG